MMDFESKLGDEILHFTGSLHCLGDRAEVSKQMLTAWAARVISKDKRIKELEAQLAELHALWKKVGKNHQADGCICRFDEAGNQISWCSEHATLRDSNQQLRDAIRWALGYTNFRCRGEGEGAFWWRKELRERSGLTKKALEES